MTLKSTVLSYNHRWVCKLSRKYKFHTCVQTNSHLPRKQTLKCFCLELRELKKKTQRNTGYL